MDYITKLKALDLNDKEIAIYTKGLELGEFTISSISRETGIKRPTCYLVVEDLIRKNLLILIPRGRKNLYQSASPEKLIENLDEKMSLANILLPYLKNIEAKKKSAPSIHFYRGRKGIETLYNGLLKAKPGTVLYSISPTEQIEKMVGKDFFNNWAEKRIQRKIHSKVIMPISDEKSTFLSSDSSKLRECRYLPKPFLVNTTIGVYDDKVAFFSSTKDNFSFIVHSEEFATMVKNIFEFLWSLGTK